MGHNDAAETAATEAPPAAVRSRNKLPEILQEERTPLKLWC